MKRFLLLLFFIIVTVDMVMGQAIIATKDADLTGYATIPRETVFVHFNSTLLFPAEYLYYRVYCRNEKGTGNSRISKVAYVELVGEDLIPVFKHKIQLTDGLGQGDFFVPTSVPSGNYKLIAYTNWMKNAGETNFFQNDIAIINPYQEDQKALLPPVRQKDSLTDSRYIGRAPIAISKENANIDSGPLQLSLNARRFGKRKKVTLNLKDATGSDSLRGHYSISVRKVGTIPRPSHLNSYNYLETFNATKQRAIGKGSQIFLPELRGDLFSGRVLDTKKGGSTSNLDVAMSLPGEDYRFRIAKTNNEGAFYMNMKADYTAEIGAVQVIGENGSDYDVQLDEPGSVAYSQLIFGQFRIDDTMGEEILQRSVHNQIESAYFSFRPDSLLPVQREMPFLENHGASYHLEDYTPFKTIREALLEIIKNVWVRWNKQGSEEIEVKSIELVSHPNLLPMIIIDGVIAQDHKAILDFDARRLKTIQVYQDRYIFGPQIYQGAIVFTTKNGDYQQGRNNSMVKVFNTFKPQPRKNYFVQNYDKAMVLSQANLPDDRLQLVWVPHIKFVVNANHFDFYTSDVPGEFEINIEGFTELGEPISLRETFSVD
jgi:hypothetical protein